MKEVYVYNTRTDVLQYSSLFKHVVIKELHNPPITEMDYKNSLHVFTKGAY